MSSPYDDYIHQAHDLQDIVDNHSHPQAMALQHELHQVTEDFKMEKDPRHMDDRLKNIDHALEQAKHQSQPVMSYQDLEDLQHRYRRLRESFRNSPHFR
jgi:hypothetical protein